MIYVFMSLCHELRTPVYTIRNAVHHLRDEVAPADQATFRLIGIIERNVDRMISMVEKALAIMSVTSGNAYSETTADFRLAVVRAIESMRSSNPDYEHRIEFTCGDGLPNRVPVKLKPFVVEQCVAGLIANAIQYGVGGADDIPEPIEVRLSANSNTAILEVIDHGPGIPEAEQLDLFKPFYRAASTQHLKQSGLGLGLALVRSVAESCQGCVGVNSRCGVGSTFWMKIPICRTDV